MSDTREEFFTAEDFDFLLGILGRAPMNRCALIANAKVAPLIRANEIMREALEEYAKLKDMKCTGTPYLAREALAKVREVDK